MPGAAVPKMAVALPNSRPRGTCQPMACAAVWSSPLPTDFPAPNSAVALAGCRDANAATCIVNAPASAPGVMRRLSSLSCRLELAATRLPQLECHPAADAAHSFAVMVALDLPRLQLTRTATRKYVQPRQAGCLLCWHRSNRRMVVAIVAGLHALRADLSLIRGNCILLR